MKKKVINIWEGLTVIKKIIATIMFLLTTLSGPVYAVYDIVQEHNEMYAFMNEHEMDDKTDRVLYLEKRYCNGERCKSSKQFPDDSMWKEYQLKILEIKEYWKDRKA